MLLLCFLKNRGRCHFSTLWANHLHFLVHQSNAKAIHFLLVLSYNRLSVMNQLLDVVILIGVKRKGVVHPCLKAEIILVKNLIVEIVMSVLLYCGNE